MAHGKEITQPHLTSRDQGCAQRKTQKYPANSIDEYCTQGYKLYNQALDFEEFSMKKKSQVIWALFSLFKKSKFDV